MLIHHITNGVRYVTQVTLSATETDIEHYKEGNVHKSHRKMITKLTNEGDVFVPIRNKTGLVARSSYELFLEGLKRIG